MCGRYYIDLDAIKDAEDLCERRNNRIRDWLCTDTFKDMLQKKCVELRKKTDYEQMNLSL